MKQILIRMCSVLLYLAAQAKEIPTTTAPTTSGELSGKYVNTLGSVMDLICTGSAGTAVLTGTYESAVGDAAGSYPLLGQATSCGNEGQGGFSVAWVNEQHGSSFSATSWVFQAEQDGERIVLYAPWMLVQETSEKEAWAANNFGFDWFTKQGNPGDIIEVNSPSTISK